MFMALRPHCLQPGIVCRNWGAVHGPLPRIGATSAGQIEISRAPCGEVIMYLIEFKVSWHDEGMCYLITIL